MAYIDGDAEPHFSENPQVARQSKHDARMSMDGCATAVPMVKAGDAGLFSSAWMRRSS